MDKAYLDPANPGSFGGANRLMAALKPRRSWKDVRKYLQSVDAYTLHRRKVRKFRRNRFILKGINDLWQSDLADMSALSTENNGVKYLLVTIDCFSKLLWVQPLKNKTATTVTSTIGRFIEESNRKPKNWQVDKGGEFRNQRLKELMLRNGINFYTTQNPDTKAAIAERVIRTLKSRIYKYLTANLTSRYLDVLQDFVTSYNGSVHRTIGMKPADVKEKHVQRIMKRMYPPRDVKVRYRFAVGDQVRLAIEKRTFEKGYQQGWTEEIFTVSEQTPRDPPVYRVKDSTDEAIEGTFYAQELQKVVKEPEAEYLVEKVLKRRKRGRRIEYLVKWLGYPEAAATWEPADNIRIIDK